MSIRIATKTNCVVIKYVLYNTYVRVSGDSCSSTTASRQFGIPKRYVRSYDNNPRYDVCTADKCYIVRRDHEMG